MQRAEQMGTVLFGPPMPVADLGEQVVFTNPTGAGLAAWQPGTFHGFGVLETHATPSWFELHTTDFERAVSFYEEVVGVRALMMSDADEFRYATIRSEDTELDIAGILDARSMLGESGTSHWTTYWEVDDIDESTSRLLTLGDSVIDAPIDTPYGRMATVADLRGAQFRLRTGPSWS